MDWLGKGQRLDKQGRFMNIRKKIGWNISQVVNGVRKTAGIGLLYASIAAGFALPAYAQDRQEDAILEAINKEFPRGIKREYNLGQLFKLRQDYRVLESMYHDSYMLAKSDGVITDQEFFRVHKEDRYKNSGKHIDSLLYSGQTSFQLDGPPGLPINYWDSPSGCLTCSPSTGVFRDGLHFLDGRLVELMMDCNGDGSKDSNVNKSSFQTTLMNGAYDILVEEETSSTCGYNISNPSRNNGDARIDGLLAYPRDLALTSPGASLQQRLDAYTNNLRMTDNSTLDWMPGNPEATVYDVVRGTIADLRAAGGLGGVTVTPIECSTAITSVSGTTLMLEDPAAGTAFFYVVRPRNAGEVGNYGRATSGTRSNPAVGDCPL